MADKAFDSIIDAFLAEREPDWKDLGLKEAEASGEELLDRTHQYVDEDFVDAIAEGASKHTALPNKSGNTLQNRLYEKEKAQPMVTAVKANWHTAASEDGKAENDTESLMNEVTMTIEQAGKEGKVEKKEISDAAIQKYIKSLLNSGMAPNKVAAKLEKLAELELFNHQMSTDYLQRNAGMIGLAYLEPNTFMDKANPNYKHAADSKDCVRSLEGMKKSGITPAAKSVKQIKACSDCSYFKKDASGKRCNLYHLPVIANTAELTQIVNNLTPGVPKKQKHAALVEIANRTDQHVQPFDAGKTAQTNIVKTADAHVNNQAARVREEQKSFTASHLAKLHDKGVALKDIYKWADKKFGSVETSVAFRGFVQSFRKNEKGRVVVAASDLKFLNSIGIRSEKFEGATKCASCPSHFARTERAVEEDRGALRVSGKFAERTLDAVRVQKQASEINFTADSVEKLHSAGHSIKKIYDGASRKVGSVQAKKAVTDFINSIKNKPIKIALSQIDCSFLKNKLGVHNPIVGASKCADCSYRHGMSCSLTGGTLLSFPGMNTAGKTASAEGVKDGYAVLNEYDLSSPVQGPDIDVSGPERLDVQTNATFSLDE